MLAKRLLNPAVVATVVYLLLCNATGAVAEGIGGFAEYNYSLLDTKMNDANGSTKTQSTSLNQRYSLTVDKTIFPTLRFSAMGNFATTAADNEINGLSATSDSSRINANADLSYTNGVFSGGAGLSRRRETSKTNGASVPALFSDTYTTRFGWRPDDLPSLDIIYTIFDSYDENHSTRDTTASTATISSRYKPYEPLNMTYSANYTTLDSILNGFESQSLSQSLRTSYSDIFFKDRMALSSSYTISMQDTTTHNAGSSTGGGILPPTLKSIDQLYFSVTATTDNAAITPSLGGPLNQNAVTSVTGTVISDASLTPVRNNIGLKSNFSTVNIIRLPVTIGVIAGHSINAQDYTDITNAFGLNNIPTSKIKLYRSLSSDGSNWQPLPVTAIAFGLLTNPTTGVFSDGFEIRSATDIPAATLIKIEIESVQNSAINLFVQKIALAAPEVYLQDTAITSLKPGQSRSSSQVSGIFDFNLKTRLLTTPSLFYDLGFNLDHTKSDTQELTHRYTVVNGLSLNHRFSPTLSTSARVAREDSDDPTTGTRSSNSASISLSSQTLPTLTQSATYGFREESDADTSRTSHSINLSNSAELYRGISLNVSAGGNTVSDTTGTDQKSLSVTGGLSLTPHRNLSINMSASDTETWSSGPGKPETSTATKTGELTVTCNPLPAVYLFGSYNIIDQTGRKVQTAQSIGGSWSPFRGGALLLNTSYRENIDNNGNKDRTAVQSLRWNIRSGWYLDVSWLMVTTRVAAQTTDTRVFNTALRLSF